MRNLLTAIVWLLLLGCACGQSLPPTQTINQNQGVACNGINSQGTVALCMPSTSYGCSSGANTNQILSTDGLRNSILFQDTGTIPIILTFGDSANGNNGFVVQPGNSFLWSNLNQGNLPGHVATTSISINSFGNSTCVFMFTD